MSSNKKTYLAEKKERINSFDALKGLVILIAVTWGHYWQFTPAGYFADGKALFWTEVTNRITQFSFFKTYSFMELLLIISGFQMFPYMHKILENDISFLDYLKRRIARLFPLPAITSIYMFLMGQIYLAKTGESWMSMNMSVRHLVLSLFNIQSWVTGTHCLNGPLWYVSVYFLCLVLFYPLVKLGQKLNIGILSMVLPVILGIYLYITPTDKLLQNSDLMRGYFGFFIGVIIAYICSKLSSKQISIYFWISAPVFLLLFIFYSTIIYTDSALDKVLIATVMLYAPLLMYVSTNKTADKVLGNKVLTWLGKISFSLYVINFPFYITLAVLEKLFGFEIPYGSTYMYYLMTLIQLILAFVVHNTIEKKLSKVTVNRI